MRIHRTAPTRSFSSFANALIRDHEISWCAAGVLMYLLSLPSGAHASIRSLALLRKEGRTRIAEALRELEERRYLRRLVVKDPGTGLFSTEYELFDTPYDQFPAEDDQLPEAIGEFTGSSGTKRASGDPVGGAAGPLPSGAKTGVKRPPTPPVAESDPPVPESLRSATGLLLALRRTDARLALGVAEAVRLAPLVAEWRAAGASDQLVRGALTSGLPPRVHCAAALLGDRLRRKMPQPVRVVAPPPECEECRAPVASPGLCPDCDPGRARSRTAVTEFALAARRGAAAARAACVG
ncbi:MULTISPECIES: hypothetical protein [unclassified Streptomyces]|uniref:hypothetical protein n=1 Tax=unclassified Streptomyces TaxID=2593676 RepID=UPI0037FCFA84